MGAGFGGRLFRTLRETYSYTYTPYAYLTSTKYTNRTECGADVRASVTDSSISVILEQLDTLCSELDPEEHLSRMKKYVVGQYYMAFASKDYVGNLIQNADFFGQNIEEVKNLPLTMQNMSAMRIMEAAKKYMQPKNAYIVVVGDPSVKDKISKFGKIYEYNMDYEPETGENAKFEKSALSVSQVCDKYTEAIGGKNKINAVNTLTSTGSVNLEMQGQSVKGSYTEKFKNPNKYYQMMDFGMVKQGTWFNGTKGWALVGTTNQEMTGEDLDRLKGQAGLFKVAKLADGEYQSEVLGLQKGFLVVKSNINGVNTTFYFDANTNLLMKQEYVEKMEDTPMPITETYSDYKSFDGIMFPVKISIVTPMYNIDEELEYKINEEINDSEFQPK